MMRTLTPFYKLSTLPKWSTIDPYTFNGTSPHTVTNILDGKKITYPTKITKPDPIKGDHFLSLTLP
jgi:hypothetical protein